jgi:magnesium chelatase subunit H
MERSFLASLRQAAATVRDRYCPSLEVAIHVLPDLEHSDQGWQAVAADVTVSLAVFAVHVTDEASAQRIVSLVESADLRAFVPLNCVGSLMQRARLGKLRLAEQSGFMSGFGRLIRRPNGKGSAESLAGLAAKASRWLRFAPGGAQDFGAYLQLYTYYLNGSPQNLQNLLLLTLQRYAGLDVPVEPPVEYPPVSLYHPDAPRLFETLEEYLAWFQARPGAPPAAAPRVGIILFRSFVLNHNTTHYDAVIRAIEARGLTPLPALAFAMDNRTVQERYFQGAAAILSLTGFGYVGGMGANDASAAVEALSRQDVPYLDALALSFQRIEDWLDSASGLNPLQAMMQVAIPELDGATEPFVFGGIGASGDGFQPLPERIERLADRLDRRIRLRTKPNAEKRVAIALFSFPPNAGTLGTAAYLDVFASLHGLLSRLQAEGYSVGELPDGPDELRRLVAEGNAAEFGTPAHVAARMPVAEYTRGWPWWREVAACWGPPPGTFNARGSELLILGRHFGNVFIGVQPTFGYEGDPLRLVVATGQTPHHGFCAFYHYLQNIWQADAVLHFGTHGALEFMPGKQVGLSAQCWPDRLIGSLPHVYLYSAGNPSEGTIAKRRGYGTLVSYLSPPLQQAGLYKDLLRLKDAIDAYRRTGDPELLGEIRELAREWQQQRDADGNDFVMAVLDQLREIEERLIPTGLHILDQPVDHTDTLKLAAEHHPPATIAQLQRDLAAQHELDGIVHALAGGYVRPSSGGDVIRNPASVPTGRNLHGLNPALVPTPVALRQAQRTVDLLLDRAIADTGAFPRSIGLVLWGTDNLKTDGEAIAQVLCLLGTRPLADDLGRLHDVELIPLASLGRPRIDVVVTASGIFRDIFANHLSLLDRAFQLAATAEEPPEQNYVRAHALATAAELGLSLEEAARRIFSNAPGVYGTNVNFAIENRAWQREEDLARIFLSRKSFAYGSGLAGQQAEQLFNRLLARVDVTFQNIDSLEFGVTDIDHYTEYLGGMTKAVEHIRGSQPAAYLGDFVMPEGKVRSVEEMVALETRTKTLNPRWYEGMLAHGYEGAREIESHVTNTFGWSATCRAVPGWVYDSITSTYMLDRELLDRLKEANPHAAAGLAGRLLEAESRGYWQASADVLARLRQTYLDLEAATEGSIEANPAIGASAGREELPLGTDGA